MAAAPEPQAEGEEPQAQSPTAPAAIVLAASCVVGFAFFLMERVVGSIFMRDTPEVLAGYEETASLGPDAEGRILRAVIGQAVRKLVTSDWSEPLDHLLAWARGNPAPRFRQWLPSMIPRAGR